MYAFLGNLLMKYWMQSLLILVFAAGSAWVMNMKSERDDLRAEIARRDQIAAEANTQAEKNLEHIRTAIPVMVAAATANSDKNYCARYPDHCRPRPRCPVVDGVQSQAGSDGQAQDTSRVDAASGEQLAPPTEFINACARDAGRLNLWIEACKSSPLLCEVVP